MNTVTSTIDNKDGTHTVTYFGKPIGYVQKVRLCADDRRAYRGVTIYGTIVYGSTLDAATHAITLTHR